MEDRDSKTFSLLKSSILSRPRMMGTPAEKETAQFLLDHLQRAGLSPFTEEIQWSRSLVVARKVRAALLIPWLVSFNIGLNVEGTAGGLSSIILPLLSLLFIVLLGKAIKDDKFSYLGRTHPGKNVICDIQPLPGQDPEKRIYFTAHTDSVGSSLPKLNLPLTIGGFLLFLLSLITTVMGGIVALAVPLTGDSLLASLQQILLIMSITSGLLITISLFAKRVNTSPGAIDNGSGSAILLCLAEHFHNNPLERASLRFIFCAAEEWGLYGSKGYVSAHKDELMEQVERDVLINVDMVGSELAYVDRAGLIFRKPLNKRLNGLIAETADMLGVEVRGFGAPIGYNSDHAPFRKLKMETAFFLSKKDTKKIHKPLDTIEGVDPNKLDDAVSLLKAVVHELDRS